MLPSCQPPGAADEMGQAGLPRLHPVAVHSVAVTDQDASPVVDEGGKGVFRPVGMNHVERRRVTDHHPQPLERAREKPGRFIDVVDHRVTHLRGNRCIVRLDGLGHAVEHFLDGSQADGHPQHRVTQALHDTPPVAVGPRHFGHERTEPWAIPRGMLGRHLGFTPAPTVRTPALMQYPVGHVHRDRRQLKHLMRMVGRGQGKRRVATRTPLGPQFLDRRGRQEYLAMAWMARFPPALRDVVAVVRCRGFL